MSTMEVRWPAAYFSLGASKWFLFEKSKSHGKRTAVKSVNAICQRA